MKVFRKTLALLLAVVLLIGALPVITASASENIELALDTPLTVDVSEDELIYFSFVPEESGYYVFYSESENGCDPHVTLYDSDLEEIGYSDDCEQGWMFSISAYLEADNRYYYHVGDWNGNNEEFTVCLEKTVGIDSLKIVSYPDRMDYWEGFVYDAIEFSGLELEATLTDGTTELWRYDYDGPYIAGYYVDWDCYSYDDGIYEVMLTCGECAITYELNIVECPVESIELVEAPVVELYELEYDYYDEELDRYFYSYDIPDDIQIKINYKDGTSYTAAYDETVDGIDFAFYDNQDAEGEENAWGIGKNPVYIEYADQETSFDVIIKKSPVTGYTINSNPSYEYILGDSDYGFIDDEGKYNFWPFELTDFSVTLHLEDGTEKTLTADDFDFNTGVLDDGHAWNIYVSSAAQAGPTPATIFAYGEYIEFSVNVVESPVESVKVLKAPDRVEYEYDYYPDFTGMQVEVTYKDGTKKVVTANEDTLHYELVMNAGFYIYIMIDDVPLYITEHEDFEQDTVHHELSILGHSINYHGIEYTDTREAENAEIIEFDPTGQGMVVNLEYPDGTEETITYDVLTSISHGGVTEGYAYTENGVLYFEIDDAFEELGYYAVYIPMFRSFVYYYPTNGEPVVLGDVDGDGQVSVVDAAYIQKLRANLIEFTDAQMLAGDTDGDGQVSVVDAAYIQKLKAQLIDKLPAEK